MRKKKLPESATLRERVEALTHHSHCPECDPYGFYGTLVELDEVLALLEDEEMKHESR